MKLIVFCIAFLAMESVWCTMATPPTQNTATTASNHVVNDPTTQEPSQINTSQPPTQPNNKITTAFIHLMTKGNFDWIDKSSFEITFWVCWSVVVIVSLLSMWTTSRDSKWIDGIQAIPEQLAKSYAGFGFVGVAYLTLFASGIAFVFSWLAKYFVDATDTIPEEIMFFLIAQLIGDCLSFYLSMSLTGTPFHYFYESSLGNTIMKFCVFLVIDAAISADAYAYFAYKLYPDTDPKQFSFRQGVFVALLTLVIRVTYSLPMQSYYVIAASKKDWQNAVYTVIFLLCSIVLFIFYFGQGRHWRPSSSSARDVYLGHPVVGYIIALILLMIAVAIGFLGGQVAHNYRYWKILEAMLATRVKSTPIHPQRPGQPLTNLSQPRGSLSGSTRL